MQGFHQCDVRGSREALPCAFAQFALLPYKLRLPPTLPISLIQLAFWVGIHCTHCISLDRYLEEGHVWVAMVIFSLLCKLLP